MLPSHADNGQVELDEVCVRLLPSLSESTVAPVLSLGNKRR